MEVILSVGFGRSLDVQNGKGGELYEAACAVFRGFSGKEGKTLHMLGTVSCKFHLCFVCMQAYVSKYI